MFRVENNNTDKTSKDLQAPFMSLEGACFIAENGDLHTAYQLMQTSTFWYDAISLSRIWHKKLSEISSIKIPPLQAKAVLQEIYRLKNQDFKSAKEVYELILQKNEKLDIEYAELFFHTPCLSKKFSLASKGWNGLFTPYAMNLNIVYSARRMMLMMQEEEKELASFSIDRLKKEFSPHTPLFLKNKILDLAVVNQSLDLAKLALASDANPNTFNFDASLPRTLLQVAATHANTEMMKLLMEHGASPTTSTALPEAMILFGGRPLSLLSLLQHYKKKYANKSDSTEIMKKFAACEELLKNVNWSHTTCPIEQITIEQIENTQYSQFLSHYYHRDKEQVEEIPTANVGIKI